MTNSINGVAYFNGELNSSIFWLVSWELYSVENLTHVQWFELNTNNTTQSNFLFSPTSVAAFHAYYTIFPWEANSKQQTVPAVNICMHFHYFCVVFFSLCFFLRCIIWNGWKIFIFRCAWYGPGNRSNKIKYHTFGVYVHESGFFVWGENGTWSNRK